MRHQLLTTLALLGMFSVAGIAADDKSKDKVHQEKTMTGCLTTAPSGNEYVFVEQGTGKQITVAGNPGLSKHAKNHTVKITTSSAAPSGEAGVSLNVSKIEHVSDSCPAK